MNSVEIWKPISRDSLGNRYEVSNFGNIRNIKTKRNLKPYKSNPGGVSGQTRYRTKLYNGTKSFNCYVDELVAEEFMEDYSKKYKIIHKDGNIQNCHVDNLELVEKKYNIVTDRVEKKQQNTQESENTVIEVGISDESVEGVITTTEADEIDIQYSDDLEVWRDIEGYDGVYQVSNFGNVRTAAMVTVENGYRTRKPPKLLNTINRKGVKIVKLANNGVIEAEIVGDLVAEAFSEKHVERLKESGFFDVTEEVSDESEVVEQVAEPEFEEVITNIKVIIPQEIEDISYIGETWGILDLENTSNYYVSNKKRLVKYNAQSGIVDIVEPDRNKKYKILDDSSNVVYLNKYELAKLIKYTMEVTETRQKSNNVEVPTSKTVEYSLPDVLVDDLEGEIWKDIEGYGGEYQVSNLGRFKKVTITNRIEENLIKVSLRNDFNRCRQYKVVRIDGKERQANVVVATAFVPKPETVEKIHVRPIDGDPTNINADNLQWVQRSQISKKLKQLTKKELRQLSKADEDWYTIDGFEDYLISNKRRIVRIKGTENAVGTFVNYKKNIHKRGYGLYNNKRLECVSMQEINKRIGDPVVL